jgi:hypothetical protein
MGIANLPKKLQQYVVNRRRKLEKLRVLGASITAEEQEQILRGAICSNIAEGTDRAPQSIRLGMQDRRVSMLSPESTSKVIVVQPPPAIWERLRAKLEAEQLVLETSERESYEGLPADTLPG